jgi:Tol biopolymer transport system component
MGTETSTIFYALRISAFLALTVVFTLYVSGCEEGFLEDSEPPADSQTYLSPQHSLAWSPDGSMLAFIFDNLLVVKEVETGRLRQLTGTGFYDEPTWSPDSIMIAYSSSSYTERANIWVKNADASTVAKRITSHTAADYHPRWSPDGTRIAFHSRRGKSIDIWIRNADGTGEDTVVASDPATDQDAEWSPDGTKLAFESKRSGNFDIWVVGIDGASSPVQITFDEASDTQPMWSPDGTRIAFQSDRGGSRGVWVKNADGTGNAVQVSVAYTDAGMHDWSHDGSRIAFVSDLKIFARNSDGMGDPVEIAGGLEPRWSPDGTKMAYVAWMEDQYKVQIIELPADLR